MKNWLLGGQLGHPVRGEGRERGGGWWVDGRNIGRDSQPKASIFIRKIKIAHLLGRIAGA